MLPAFLQSSLKTYKEDTDTIAAWLATKAKQCGYPADLLDHADQLSPPESSKRLKGKARKKSKYTAKPQEVLAGPSKASTTPSARPSYVIKVKDFITLAEFIAVFNKPVVRVPGAFVNALDRAIDLRKQHNDYSRGESSSGRPLEQNPESDERHSYFLGILERTREVLKPRLPSEMIKDSLTKPNGESEKQTASELGNKFANLDIQEPSQAFIDAPDIVPAPKAKIKPHYEAETLHSLAEQYTAAHCLFQDVRNIRSFLRRLWDSYLQGMDIVAVSITINTAIDFIRSLEDDYFRQFPEQSGFEQIVQLFHGAQCLHRGHNPSNKRPEDPFNFAVYDLAEECLLSTFVLLSSVQDVIVPGELPVYKPGHFGVRDTRSSWDQKSPREKFQDDKLVMLEAFPDLMLMTMVTEKSPLAEDELIRGFRGMAPDKDIPLWLVFAAQCFLDAQHVLKADTSRPHAQLMQTANAIKSSIKQNLDFHQTLRIDNWPRTNDYAFSEMLMIIDEWVGRDLVAVKLKKIQRNMPVPDPKPFRLLKQYPLLCGLFTFTLKTRFQELGLTFSTAWGSLLYTGHLYNATRQEKFLLKSWKDLELLIMLQSDEKFFVGDRPKGLEEYLKRFLLSMGYSATAFASNRRKNVPIASSRGPRSLSRECKVGSLFAGRYSKNDANVAWTTESLAPIMESMMTSEDEDSEEDRHSSQTRSSTAPRSGAKSNTKKARKVKQSSTGPLLRKPKGHKSSEVPTLDFLELLANALHAEALGSTVDYLRLHRLCWTLLRQVNEACKPRLLEIYGAGYLEKECQLPFVVGYIFMTATTTSRVANVLLPRKDNVVVSSQLLKTAAECIESMIDSGLGGMETKIIEKVHGYELDFSALDDTPQITPQ